MHVYLCVCTHRDACVQISVYEREEGPREGRNRVLARPGQRQYKAIMEMSEFMNSYTSPWGIRW